MRTDGRKVDLDYEATKAFFEERGRRGKALGRINATAYQDSEPDLAVRRDAAEKALVGPHFLKHAPARILDLGCGVGRWAENFEETDAEYLGLDYSSEFVALCHERFGEDNPRLRFQALSVTELGSADLLHPGPFDLALISGLCIYLNDGDLDALFADLIKKLAPTAMIYIREPVSLLEVRLSLHDHYSEELNTNYNAIYRTRSEYMELFERHLTPAGFHLREDGDVYPSELNNRKETRQAYFLLTAS